MEQREEIQLMLDENMVPHIGRAAFILGAKNSLYLPAPNKL